MTEHNPASDSSCPVPLEFLALLLRCSEARLGALVDELPEAPRAALAVYCFGRYHMRRLGLAVALRCSERSLENAGGAIGRHALDLARNAAGFDADRGRERSSGPAPVRAAA